MISLDQYLDEQLSRGRACFSREETLAALGLSPEVFIAAVSRMARKQRLATPRRGFYLILRPEDRVAGAPDPEDINLVQTQPEAIGTVDATRDALSWLGKCNRAQAGHSIHLVFKFAPEVDPEATLKLKVEINTREHENLYGIKKYPFEVDSRWHRAKTDIASFEPEELFGTKLRVLLQRRKNRDLFDLNEGSNSSRWIRANALPASNIIWRWRVSRFRVPSLNSGCWRNSHGA